MSLISGTFKIPLKSQKAVGVCASRGARLYVLSDAPGKADGRYQEDATSIHALQLDTSELKQALDDRDVEWDPEKSGTDFLARQTAFFGIYDG